MNDKQIANLRADLLQKIRASGADVKEIRKALTELAGDVETCAHQLDIAPAFSATGNYAAGDLVYNDGALYRFTADHTAGTWTGEDVELTDIASLLDDLSGDISDLQPVDEVTDGNNKPVTSKGVFDYLNDSVTITRNDGETVKSFFNRVYAAIDKTKLTPYTKLLVGPNSVFPVTSWTNSGINFLKTTLYGTTDSMYEQLSYIYLHATDSVSKYVNFSTTGTSGSGNSVGWAIVDQTESTTAGPATITIYYR